MREIILSLIVFFGSIWGGAYLVYFTLAEDSWMYFPAFMSATLIGFGGLIWFIYSLVDYCDESA